MRDQGHVAECDLIPVVQYSVHFRDFIESMGRIAVLEVAPASCLDYRNVCVHDHVLGPGERLNLRAPRTMIPVRMADQQNLCIGKVEPEFFDAVPDQWY